MTCNGGPKISSSKDQQNESHSKMWKRKGTDQICHLFCRECALSNLVQQRQEIKRLEKERDTKAIEAEAVEAHEEEEARKRVVREFERAQNGVGRGHIPTSSSTSREERPGEGRRESQTSGGDRKRKFELDEDELVRVVREDRAKARRALDDEKASDAKSKLPSFWLPSLTPEYSKSRAAGGGEIVDLKKASTMCPGSSSAENAHVMTMKSLVTVKFSRPSGRDNDKDTAQREEEKNAALCPACNRSLSNSSSPTIAKPCGHVLCGSCVQKFILDVEDREDDDVLAAVETEKKLRKLRCFVCTEDVTPKRDKEKNKEKDGKKDKVRPGLVEISCEGTGFASAGTSMVKKEGVTFQC